jgi:nucleoside-diphosphate-sugar epimerase
MRVFLTGATGFIGSHLVPELIAAGHQVVGLSRSDEGEKNLARAGAESFRGDINDLVRLREAAGLADAAIHAAFNHDFANIAEHAAADHKVIETLGDIFAARGRPLIVTSGTGLVQGGGKPAKETDPHASSAQTPRAATEEAADALIDKGWPVMVMRLPQVHDTRRAGTITVLAQIAQKKGRAAYVGDGANRRCAAHISDVVRLYRLAIEGGKPGARYHAVVEEAVSLRAIAEAIGEGLKVPVESLTPDEAPAYFGWMANLAQQDLPASGAWTRAQLNWMPTGPDLLRDLRAVDVAGL